MKTHSINWSSVLGAENYRGSAFGWIFLILAGLINLFRGSVHTFAEDGGAARIAGIDLSQNGEVILALFAGMGVTQLLMAGVDFAVALRFRVLTPVVVGYHFLQSLFAALVLWLYKPLPLDAPGKFGLLVMVPVSGLALWASLRKPAAQAETAPLPVREAS